MIVPTKIEAIVYRDAEAYSSSGKADDHIVVDFTTDTSAPEADIVVAPANDNTTVYENDKGVFVATDYTGGVAGLSITSDVTKGSVDELVGYLLYQVIDLDAMGNPAKDEDGNPVGIWEPLTT